MTRMQGILVAALAVQVVVLALLGFGADEQALPEGQALFPKLAPDDVQKLVIEDGEAETDDALTIVRDTSGWTLPAYDGYPADSGKVEAALTSLSDLDVRRPIVTSSRYHDELEVSEDAFVRRVRAESTEGQALAELWMGSAPNFQLVHVRAAGDDAVYEARGISTWEFGAEPASWIEAELIDVDEESVVEVHVDNPEGSLSLLRDVEDEGEGAWRLDGAEGADTVLDDEKVESFVRSLTTLRIKEPAGRVDESAQGLDDPQATLELVLRDAPDPADDDEGAAPATRVRVLVGAESGSSDDARFAHREGSKFAVLLTRWESDKIVTKALEDLLPDDEE